MSEVSAQVKLRAHIARMKSGTEFTTGDIREFLKSSGFGPEQSGTLLTYMITWWKLIERVKFGHYRRL